MKRYKEYKDSGVSWIGEIPAHWIVCKAKYVFEEGDEGIKIGPFGSALKGKTQEEGPYKIYNQAHLIQNDFTLNRHFISEETFKELSNYIIEPGDILFSMMGTIGKCEIMPSGLIPGIMDSHLLKAKLNSKIAPQFFEYVYDKDNSNVVIEQLLYKSNGSIMNGLNSSIVKNLYFPLPRLSEQKSISDYLDRKTAAIDSLIEDKQKLIELLKEKRQAIISEAVTKGLDKNTKMKDSGIEWIGKIPEDWEVKRLKQVSRLKTGTTPAGNEGINYDNNGLCWFTPADFNPNMKLILSEKFIDENTIKSKNITVYPKNSVLLVAIGATVGKIGYTIDDSYSNQQITAIIPNQVLGKHLLYYIASKANYIKENALYTTLPIINNAYLGSIYVVIPTREEQIQIVNYIDQQTEEIDSLTADITEQIEKLKEYRQAIISEAVTGKVAI